MGRRRAYEHKMRPGPARRGVIGVGPGTAHKVHTFQLKAKLFSTTENISMQAAKQLKKLVVQSRRGVMGAARSAQWQLAPWSVGSESPCQSSRQRREEQEHVRCRPVRLVSDAVSLANGPRR